MRLFRKCAQEDVNHEYQTLNSLTEATKNEFNPSLRYSTKPIRSRYSYSSRIRNIQKSNRIRQNVGCETRTGQSSDHFGQNEANKILEKFKSLSPLSSLLSTSIPSNSSQQQLSQPSLPQKPKILQSKFHKNRQTIIVALKNCEKLVKMLKIIINFLYFVTLNPLLLMFRYKTIQFLDSSFISNTKPTKFYNNKINKNSYFKIKNKQQQETETDLIELLKNNLKRRTYNKTLKKFSELERINRKTIVNKNQNVVLRNPITDEFNNISIVYNSKTSSTATTTTTSSLLSFRNVQNFRECTMIIILQLLIEKSKRKLIKCIRCIILRRLVFKLKNKCFYSYLNFCDKFVQFLKFYCKRVKKRIDKFDFERAKLPNFMEFKNDGIDEGNDDNRGVDNDRKLILKSEIRNFLQNFQKIRNLRILMSFAVVVKLCAGLLMVYDRILKFVKGSRTSGYCEFLWFLNKWWCRRRNCMEQDGLERRNVKRKDIHQFLGVSLRTLRIVFLIAFITCMPYRSVSFHHNIKYSINVVKTKYGPLRGVIVRSNPTVEAFLGVPYASPPVGSLRYMPPVTPSTWRNPRLADRFSAVCPQAAPVPPSGPEALLEVPRGRLAQLRRLLPLLANQSEDCLYLNLYVPRTLYPTPPSGTSFSGDTGATGLGMGASTADGSHNVPSDAPEDKPLPAILYIHGESYEWNSGNPYDGSVLAAHGNVIVVTINFRLGILGFLKTGGKGSAQGNFGLMDLVAGLHWLRENLPAFGGDPNKVTVMGHGTGAALANILIVSPVASDLVHRGILLSGSALSPWAIQKDPLFVKRRVAEQTGCHGDLVVDDLAPCLRTKSLTELLAVKIDSPRFLPGFAPFIDGTVIVHPSGGATGPLTLPAGSAIASTSGIELADFPNRELIFGLATIESYLDLSAQDLEFGFNETRRDRILRTYVRNIYHYHLNEIYAALKNEYTDWERPIRNPMGSRDASLEFLSDGHTAAPLIRLGYLHSLRGGRSYFIHFRHQSGERDYPQRGGSVRGEDVPFCLGLPISPLFPHNYTKQDIKISRVLIRYLTNFAMTGNPNEGSTTSVDISHLVHSKSAIVSSSAPSSMSLIAVPPLTSESLNSVPASSSSLSILKHSNDQYASSIVALSLPVSTTLLTSLSAAAPSSSLSSTVSLSLSSSSSAFLVPPSIHYQDNSLSSSSASEKMVNSKTVLLVAPPPLHAATKSKRHAVAAHRRKRKTGKHSNVRKFSKKSNFRMKLVSGNNQDDDSSFDVSSSAILADEGNDRRLNDGGHPDDRNEDNSEIEEDDDEDEDGNSSSEHHGEDVANSNKDNGEDDDEENISRSKNHNTDENDIEKFDRFDGYSIPRLPFWDTYDAINQLYLEMGNKVEVRNHYRGHKLSMWLSLIPQLHSPGDLTELPMRHHHFLEDSAQYYDGIIRPQIMQRPSFPKVGVQQPSSSHKVPATTTTTTTVNPKMDQPGFNAGIPATTECPPNTTIVPTIAATRPQNHQQNGSGSSGVMISPNVEGSNAGNKQDNNLLRRLASNQFQSYTTALTVTIAVGCFLLLLNILIFFGIYYQREKRATDAKKKEELREAETLCSSSPNLEKLTASGGYPGLGGGGGGGGKGSRKSSLQSLTGFNTSGSFGEYSCYDEKIQCKEKHALADICSVELPLKEFKCSGSPAPSNTGSLRRQPTANNAKTSSSSLLIYPPSYHHQQSAQQQQHKMIHHYFEQQGCSNNGVVTYQQYQKQSMHQYHQQQHQQLQNQPQLQQHAMTSTGSASVGTSTEQCNQSTQSEQPSVQDVATSIDEKAVADSANLSSGGDGGTGSGSASCGSREGSSSINNNDNMISPSIPEAPPPPKSTAPYQGGILRQPGPPTTPSSNKKRVQIQEISV